jgi:hypothetical protein
MTEYTCIPCGFNGKKKNDYERHVLTQKHKNKLIKEYKCTSCDIYLYNKSNYTKHLTTQKHIKNNEIYTCNLCAKTYKTKGYLLNHEKQCKVEQVKQDPNLIKYVMEQMAKQNVSMMEHMSKHTESMMGQMSKQNDTITTLVAKVGNTDNSVNSHNKTFNLQLFLNEQCKDAINWTDFIQNIKVSLEDIDVQSNITDKVIGTICKELDTLGLYKRPLHCTDVKRHKSCIKDNNEWKKDPALLEKGIKLVSGKYQKVINDDCLSTPKWFEDQELSEKIMDRMNVYMKEPEEKCMAEILKHAVIKEGL